MTPPPPPRWFWWLPLLAIAAWWPIEPYWQSDDFLAVHYASDGTRVLHDFVGPQYGATDIWFFYRPLITASFWLDQLLGGAFPPLSHASNVLAHGISTLLVALLWRRFVADRTAFAAALLWAVLPSHAGSIQWAVGRVDSHTTVWCLLTLWLALRAQERRADGTRGLSVPLALATLAALACKELAFVLPPLATGLVWLRERRAALAVTAPVWLAFVAYWPLRLVALGTVGGYAAAAWEPQPMLQGLGQNLAHLLVPLRWSGTPSDSLGVPGPVWLLAAALPPVGAVLIALLRTPRHVAAAAGLLLLAAVPITPFLSAWSNPQTQRYWYLPAVALAGVLASAGWPFVLATLLAWAWPFVAIRGDHVAADRQTARQHRAMLQEVRDGAAAPMFVAGLPHGNARGTVVQMHFGIDRALLPPFSDRAVPLYALRPLRGDATAFRLTHDDEPFALPIGSTWFFADASAFGRAPAAPPMRPLPIVGDRDGHVDLSHAALTAMIPADAPPIRLTTPGVSPAAYRLTVFTANGYLATLFANHAEPGSADGHVDIRSWLAGDGLRIGRTAPGDTYVGNDLEVPTTIDLSTAFPVLLEAGSVDAAFHFTPSHRAERLLHFDFDRGYPSWLRRVKGQ